METKDYLCSIKTTTYGEKAKFKIIYSKDADDFLNDLPTKIKDKIIYNIAKAKFVICVNYQTAESNEALYSLIKMGGADFDVIVQIGRAHV